MFHPYGYPPYDGDKLIYYNSFEVYPTYTARLETPTLDCASYNDVSLSFYMFHDTELPDSDDQIQIQVRIDGGDWESVGEPFHRVNGLEHEWDLNTVDLSELAAGESDVVVAFRGISAYGNDMGIDLITIGGTSTAPVFVSSPDTMVTVGQSYNYVAEVTDNGDLSDITFTSDGSLYWLTLTDNGDGTALLSGIPQNTNVGTNYVRIIATDGDEFSTTQEFLIVVEPDVDIESNYELSIMNYELKQNYPNPFNPVTRINYTSTFAQCKPIN